MANDNEPVEQVALSDRPLAEQIRIIRENYCIGSGEFDALDEAADVVECHKREIGELKGERKGILKANAAFAADNTRLRGELAAKDAEIAKLTADNRRMESLLQKAGATVVELMNKMNAQNEEIVKLRKLVDGLLEAATVDCATCCYDNCGPNRENCIIHEAAMYIGGMEVTK